MIEKPILWAGFMMAALASAEHPVGRNWGAGEPGGWQSARARAAADLADAALQEFEARFEAHAIHCMDTLTRMSKSG